MSPTWIRRSLLVTLALALVVTGCAKKTVKAPEVPPTPKTETAPPPPPKKDDTKVPDSNPVTNPKTAADLSTVYFALDSDMLDDASRATLDKNVEILRANTALSVNLDGYCDERGTEDYNLSLSERRANRVKEYLTGAGVSASRLTVRPYGKANPVDPGHDESAWSKNRRVEFK